MGASFVCGVFRGTLFTMHQIVKLFFIVGSESLLSMKFTLMMIFHHFPWAEEVKLLPFFFIIDDYHPWIFLTLSKV
jgi:hypothetical protein